jgi:hypothetical protein
MIYWDCIKYQALLTAWMARRLWGRNPFLFFVHALDGLISLLVLLFMRPLARAAIVCRCGYRNYHFVKDGVIPPPPVGLEARLTKYLNHAGVIVVASLRGEIAAAHPTWNDLSIWHEICNRDLGAAMFDVNARLTESEEDTRDS